MSIVRENLMNDEHYTPYCGGEYSVCGMPRTRFNGEQFECPRCSWQSQFDEEFIKQYKLKWNKL